MSTQIEDINYDDFNGGEQQDPEVENILNELNQQENDDEDYIMDEPIQTTEDNTNNQKKSIMDTCTSLIKPAIIVIIISFLLNNPFVINLFSNLEFLKDSEGSLNMVVYLILSLIAGCLFVLCNVCSDMFM